MSDAIVNLLRRAKASVSTSEADAAWPPGTHVELLETTRDGDAPTGIRGRVAFTDPHAGWVHWAGDDGSLHASAPKALRRMT